MSVFIVGSRHIDALVIAGVQYGLIAPEAMSETGRTLWAENLASVADRYPYDGDGQRPGPIRFRDADVDQYEAPSVGVILDPNGVVKAAFCYEYQSCEHPGWDRSVAHDFVRALIARAGSEADLDASGWPVRKGLPWEVHDLSEIAAVVLA